MIFQMKQDRKSTRSASIVLQTNRQTDRATTRGPSGPTKLYKKKYKKDEWNNTHMLL